MTEAFDHLRVAVDGQAKLPLWIMHLRQRLHSHRRLGLILGAGVSADAGCPLWSELVGRLAECLPEAAKCIAAHKDAGVSEPYLTQILFHLHAEEIKTLAQSIPKKFQPLQVTSKWMELVHKQLYRGIEKDSPHDLKKRHPYLGELGEICYRSHFTINFNFDDIVDEAAIVYSQAHNQAPPEVILHPRVETRRNAPVIFHINGLLPRDARRRKSENLVLTEDAFAEVLISSGSAEAEFTMSRFATTTFLLLGTSLNDNSLKNMLRVGAKRSPGNHHYVVYWEDAKRLRTKQERDQIFNVNLEVYNAISIFLTTPQIKDFLRLVNEPDHNTFEAWTLGLTKDPEKPFATRRRYYLVGSVASGKSTNLEALRCFTTFEEWAGLTPSVIYQDHASLTPEQRREVNDWIYGQLRVKNDNMRTTGPGIHIMDRGFLDLFAFSNDARENVEKIGQLRNQVKAVTGAFERGHVVFTEADEETLGARQARRGKLKGPERTIEYDGKELVRQGDYLKKVYAPRDDSVFDTGAEPADVVAKRIARLILLGEYEPFDFEKRIDDIKRNGGLP